MKRLLVVCEGQTEQEFVQKVLNPYLISTGLNNDVTCHVISQSRGGLSKYSHLEKDIIKSLYETDIVLTTLIDFYKVPTNTPNYRKLNLRESKINQVQYLEKSIKENIEQKQEREFRDFIPYIQLHEFEALIFSSIEGVKSVFTPKEANFKEIEAVIKQFPNPEDINNGENTAPSKRLKRYINDYSKTLNGIEIINSIGLENIMAKCPHFKDWINKITEALHETNI